MKTDWTPEEVWRETESQRIKQKRLGRSEALQAYWAKPGNREAASLRRKAEYAARLEEARQNEIWRNEMREEAKRLGFT